MKKAKKTVARTIKFSTRLNEKERTLLNRKAKKNKLNPSEFVRRLIAEAV
jgi:hypothetical protein